MTIQWKRFNAAEYCRRENLFKRHIYIPLGMDDKMGDGVTMRFKEGRAVLSGVTDAGKKIDRNYCVGSDLKVDMDQLDKEFKIVFTPGMCTLFYL